MKMSEIKCRLCGQDAIQASSRGAYLNRVSPKGGEMIVECVPTCDHKHGGQEHALLEALKANES